MAAEENDTGQKTEQPTGKRKSQARSDGIIARSVDLSQVMGLIAAFLALQHLSPYIWHNLIILFNYCLSGELYAGKLDVPAVKQSFLIILRLFAPVIFLLFAIAAFFGAGCTAIQTNFLWSPKLFKPKFNMINPVAGIKRIISKQNVVNLIKQILKLAIIFPIAYQAFLKLFPGFFSLIDVPISDLLPFTSYAAGVVFWRIISLLFVLAIADYIWQRYTTRKTLMMTKVEIKEERKSIEGDEQTKVKIRARALQRARMRMMDAVKKADVVVTNPTHLAVALHYTMERGSAPKVVAKGRGHMAEKIKQVARTSGVPVIERKSLARALFRGVEIGQSIPYELYAACAEIYAYVFKLKRRPPLKRKNEQTAQMT